MIKKTNTNRKREKQLGMSIGTASNRLRKKILFDLVKKTNQDNCYRCNKKITDISNLTIEHKVRWLDSKNPIELFFDLDNIAFSHSKCNVSTRPLNYTISKFGYRGIKKKNFGFCGNVRKNGKLFETETLKTPREAAIAYDKLATRFYGEDAITNKQLGLL